MNEGRGGIEETNSETKGTAADWLELRGRLRPEAVESGR